MENLLDFIVKRGERYWGLGGRSDSWLKRDLIMCQAQDHKLDKKWFREGRYLS